MAHVQITLTDAETKMLHAALEAYRKIKSAERMLEAHKRDANANEVFARYDVLLALVASVKQKI